ncbi:transcriptional regulator NrdR [Bacillota bacterium LX-D]|nr:transcriptional regulator NrdR [Bacillota bacterium LX-D]
MRCPFCNYNDSKVLDSRPVEEGAAIRRRRECLECNRRFTTYEKVENIPLVVVKKSGQREFFDSHKLLVGLIRACEKRPIPLEKLEGITADIEKELLNDVEREVKSEKIGQLVMNRLKDLDPVAYVRFASVYREFKDVQTFMLELQNLLENLNKKQED